MRRNSDLGGQHTATPSTIVQRLSLYDAPAGGAVEIPKDLDAKVIAHIESQGVEKFKGTLPKVPEKYNVKLPNNSILPETVLERTSAKAREMGLTSDAHAQGLLEFLQAEADGLLAQTAEQFKTQVKEWEKAALDAPDLGNGKPENLSAHVSRVKRLTEKFFPPAARKLLDEHGLGSHPDFIRGLSKIADLAKEDLIEVGDSRVNRKGSAADRLYGGKEKK